MHSSSLLRLPAELHLLIGNTLKEDGRLDTLAVIARTSKRLRSIYEPQLYQSPDKTKYQDALLWGANHNSIPVMAQALSYGADLDKQAQYFNSQYVDMMGTHGPVINTRATALQVAVSRGHDEAVRWLLERGAELNDMDNNPSNHACPACNRHRILQRYDDQRRSLFDSALSTGERRSLLHLAICGAQHVPTLRLLLERGASLEAAAQIDGEHAVHAAIRAELPRRERHGPLAPISRLRHQAPDEEAEDQWPPRYEPLALLKVVLKHIGTDESAISALDSIGWYQSTPLKTAIYIRDAPIMQQAITLLVRAGASLTRPVPASPHLESMSPFWWILHERGFRAEYVTALLHLGVDVKGERPDDPPPRHPLGGKSPLHFLIRHRHHTKYGPSVVRFQQSLVYLGLPDNGRGHRGLVAELVRRGARLHLADKRGYTPLGNAMSNGAEDLPPTRRVAALKMVRVMLRYVQRPGGISAELEAEARGWMEQVLKGLRAERATVEEVECPPLYFVGMSWHLRRQIPKTILLKWPRWKRSGSGSGGRLVRASWR